MKMPPALQTAVDSHPYALLFATVSGAHLYGFPSPDSDYDLRGAHILPMPKVVSLEKIDETTSSCEASSLRLPSAFTGIHLMRTGIIEANLVTLNESFCLPHIPDLVERKVQTAEKQTLSDADFDFHQREYNRPRQELETASAKSSLPDSPSAQPALDDLLKRLRMGTLKRID